MKVLIDHTFLVVDDFSSSATQQVVEEAFMINDQLGDFPAAIVMSTDLAFGLGRLWQLTIESKGGASDQISVFHSREEAEAWLMAFQL